jgi:protein ImuB
MSKRYVSIWFKNLVADWLALKKPALAQVALVLTEQDGGRAIVVGVSHLAEKEGIRKGIALVDARVLLPGVQVIDNQAGRGPKLLKALAEWCIRYTPTVSVDGEDGLLLDVTGCATYAGGEREYFKDIILRLRGSGYNVRGAIADTIGAAWAIARYGKVTPLIKPGEQKQAIYDLPPAALRLSAETQDLLFNLGMLRIAQFADLPKKALYRRFRKELVHQLEKALGSRDEFLQPVEVPIPYHERLPCFEPIQTATGIEIGLERLLQQLCQRLQKEGKGLRSAIFRCHRMDNHVQQLEIGTTHPSHKVNHLFGLFKEKLCTIEPALGIELFTLDALVVEPAKAKQDILWGGPAGLDDIQIAEWLDRVLNKLGPGTVQRFLPAEHYWPQCSQKLAKSLTEKPDIPWSRQQRRPVRVFPEARAIEVTAPIPDYPPMSFRYKGILHKRRKAAGPERIRREWWLEEGQHRDYYWFEDEDGHRYSIFRSGWYLEDNGRNWYLEGFYG